ncbi:hypothetical protein [Marinobacterium sp. MBR-109]
MISVIFQSSSAIKEMFDGFIRLGLGCNLCHYRLARQTLGQTTAHAAGQQ